MDTRCVVNACNNYGRIVLYPFNDTAKGLAAIAGTKTLSVDALAAAARMGFELIAVGDTRGAEIVANIVKGVQS